MTNQRTIRRALVGAAVVGCYPVMLAAQESGPIADGDGATATATATSPRDVSLSDDFLSEGSAGPDMTFCQLYDLGQRGREGDIVGLAMATTSWNIGDAQLPWYAIPAENHPFVAQNLYRLKTVDGSERFEQIGQSWLYHGFCAMDSSQCDTTCYPPTGCPTLSLGCTSTVTASLHAVQNALGPRYEVNPWARSWTFEGSHFDQPYHEHDEIEHRLQVHDVDLHPAQNPGAAYYAESFYLCPEDINQMNSAAWKPVEPDGSPGGQWQFDMSSAYVMPEEGFAIYAWEGATTTLLAQQVPIIEFYSPDGRCVLAAKATYLGNDWWHYEYALLNVDMDRKVGAFSIPVHSNATVTNIGFHAVDSHDEPYSNEPWTGGVVNGAVTWTTTDNPLRWGTMYNFRFDANLPPADNTTVTLGLYEPGLPTRVRGTTVGPLPGNSLADFAWFQKCFGVEPLMPVGCEQFDLAPDGRIDLEDYERFLLRFAGP